MTLELDCSAQCRTPPTGLEPQMNSVHCVVPELPGLSRTTQLCSPFRNTLVSPGSFNLGPWAKCQVLEPPKRVQLHWDSRSHLEVQGQTSSSLHSQTLLFNIEPQIIGGGENSRLSQVARPGSSHAFRAEIGKLSCKGKTLTVFFILWARWSQLQLNSTIVTQKPLQTLCK